MKLLTTSRTRKRVIRRDAIRLLRSLKLSPSFDLTALCAQLSEQRDRPIELIPRAFPQPTVFGLWVGTTTSDLVFYESDTTPEHQRHIVLHELGHILLDHGSDDLRDEVWEDLVPTLPADTVRRALRRSAYDSSAEQDAETFASVISAWSGAVAALDNRTGSDIERAFDDPKGWL